jgi:ABC-type bacteriocin/lantibiotic exporter with double-glycine peptidase domain
VKAVIQKDQTGCALAGVAALAGLSYEQVKKEATALGIEVSDERLWSDTTFIQKLLKHFKIQAASSERPFRSWAALPDCALLATKWHLERGRPFWHWVVFYREGDEACVLDPKKSLRTHRRTDFGRIRPRWFITVTKAPAANI